MCVPNRLRDPKTRSMMVIGNFSLVAAILCWHFLRPSGVAAQAWFDGFDGLLFGISIGANLTAIYRARRCAS
ncbi:MAG: hypothetical protein WB341_07785 [Terracidiphilus sp.]